MGIKWHNHGNIVSWYYLNVVLSYSVYFLKNITAEIGQVREFFNLITILQALGYYVWNMLRLLSSLYIIRLNMSSFLTQRKRLTSNPANTQRSRNLLTSRQHFMFPGKWTENITKHIQLNLPGNFLSLFLLFNFSRIAGIYDY